MLIRFVGFYYLKYFLIIFLGLEGFFLAIDTLKYIEELPDSANLLILFLFYDGVLHSLILCLFRLFCVLLCFIWHFLKAHNSQLLWL